MSLASPMARLMLAVTVLGAGLARTASLTFGVGF